MQTAEFVILYTAPGLSGHQVLRNDKGATDKPRIFTSRQDSEKTAKKRGLQKPLILPAFAVPGLVGRV